MKKYLLSFLIAVAVALVQPAQVGLADPQSYLAQDASKQDDSVGAKLSFNFRKWFLASGSLLWWAEPTIRSTQ